MSKKCTPLWPEAQFEVKMFKTQGIRTTFGVQMSKKCMPLWREAHFEVKMFKTLGVRTTFGGSDVEKVHFRCGAKHISKSKCSKHQGFVPLLEVQMSKKCMPLWREAHFEVKMFKTLGVRTTFGGSDVACLHYTTLHYTTLYFTTLHYITLHYTPVHYITLHYTLQYTPLH